MFVHEQTHNGITLPSVLYLRGNIVFPVSVEGNEAAPESGPGGSGFGFRRKGCWGF